MRDRVSDTVEPEEVETPREKLFRLHREITARSAQVMKKKNGDYSTAEDPYFNFRQHGPLGIHVRMSDKMSRLFMYIRKGSFEVEDETLEDTVIDLINYAVILRGWFLHAKQ